MDSIESHDFKALLLAEEKRFDELLRDYAQLLAEHESEVLSLHDKRRKLGRSVYLPPDFVVT